MHLRTKRQRVFSLVVCAAALGVAVVWATARVAAQQPAAPQPEPAAPQAEQWIDDPRPLAKAVRLLEQRCRCIITYEDPQYERSQVIDVAVSVSRDPKITSGVYTPAGAPFGFAFDAPPGARSADEMTPAVSGLLEAFHRSANLNRFRLDRRAAVLHVAPEKGSVLSVPISIPETQSTAADLLNTIVAAVKARAGVTIWTGPSAADYMRRSMVQLSADNEPARDVLARLLDATGRKMTWHLYYDYAMKLYGLNLFFVDPERCVQADPQGECVKTDPGDSRNAVFLRQGNR